MILSLSQTPSVQYASALSLSQTCSRVSKLKIMYAPAKLGVPSVGGFSRCAVPGRGRKGSPMADE